MLQPLEPATSPYPFGLDSGGMSLDRRCTGLALASALAVAPAAGADGAHEALARGDAAWERRAEGHAGLNAAPGPIAEAVAAYEQAFGERPGDLEARWKLMRALLYQGEYVLEGRAEKLAVFARGRDLGEAGVDQLAASAGGRQSLDRMDVAEAARALRDAPEAAPLVFWTVVHWGVWGRETGKLAAVRQGVADKVRRYSEILIGLDESFENAGGYRILGRLHFEAPKVPFITGWVDDRKALQALGRAFELGPADPLNELYLLEALYKNDRSRRAEALERLRNLLEKGPRPGHPVEDGRTFAKARALLTEWSR